ncbi:MAG: hypothetical protein A2X25_00965 [Chloroflexi bacterium GWB2_49_20]|nr:MAG: hypothetical protein A2X25_00965 [Chloroflexi bacterium GWB2_49_20]
MGIDIKHVDHELDEELVLAGLAGEDNDDGVAIAISNGIMQTGDGGDLIGAQLEAGGMLDEGGHAGEERAKGVSRWLRR